VNGCWEGYHRNVDDEVTPPRLADETTTLLIAQVGTQVAYQFAQQLRALGLLPSHAGILKALGTLAGISQRALGRRLSILPNRVLALVHELEERGLVERGEKPGDRRACRLHLSAKGQQMLALISQIARILDEQICGDLSQKEQTRLASLLSRVAAQLKFTPGVDAGYRCLVRRGRSTKQGASTTKLATGS